MAHRELSWLFHEHMQGLKTVRESYSRALEQGPLVPIRPQVGGPRQGFPGAAQSDP